MIRFAHLMKVCILISLIMFCGLRGFAQNRFPHSRLIEKQFSNSEHPESLFEEPVKQKFNSSYKTYSFHGFAELGLKQDTRHDTPTENELTVRSKVRLKLKWQPALRNPTNTSSLKLGDVTLVASLQSDYLWFGPQEATDDYDIDLFEGYVRVAHDPVEITVGKQIVRWGKTDQISPVDNVNPQDFREFITVDYEDRKIPVFMTRALVSLDFITLEGIYIPFFEPSEIDYYGTDWAVYQHLKVDTKRSNMPPAFKDYVLSREVDENEPAKTLKNGELGFRITTTVHDWDMGLSYMYTWEDLPYYASFPIKNIKVKDSASFGNIEENLQSAIITNENVRVEYKRCNIAGFEFESTLGSIGLRGEFAYFSHQSLLNSSLTSSETPVYHYVLGIDYTGVNEWYINFQISHQILDNYSDEILYFKKHNVFLNGEIRKDLWNGDITCKVRYNIGLTEKSYYLNPCVILKYFSNLETTLGVDLLGGEADTLLGYYDKSDQYYVDFKYIY